MNSAIITIILGLLVCFVLPKILSDGKKSKKGKKKKENLIYKIIGGLLIFLGIYNAITVLLGN